MQKIIESNKYLFFYGVAIFYVLISIYFFRIESFYIPFLIPVGLVFLYYYVFSLDKLLLFAVLLTPLSVKKDFFAQQFGLSIPTEPILIALMLAFVLKLLGERVYDKKIIKHPISIAIFLNLGWILMASCMSTIPIVSFKFFISRLWFIIPVFFMGILLFKQMSKISLFLKLYYFSLLIVIIYTIYQHLLSGFDHDAANWVMQPFFNDHTAYGAALALFLPFSFVLIKTAKKAMLKYFYSFLLIVMLVALFLSGSRAAWVSVLISLAVFVCIYFRIKFRWVLLFIALFISLFFVFEYQINELLRRNDQNSSSNITEQIQSIYNISTDPSNLERINRWQSALRMYKEKPVFGFGPGTYQFKYAPYQMSKEKTIISTNSGDLGNAHSEFIGPMAESGFLGMFTFVIIMICSLYYGIHLSTRVHHQQMRLISLAVVLGLVSYFTHGFLNNFLDTDKLSLPFWGFIAILVAIDIYHKKTTA